MTPRRFDHVRAAATYAGGPSIRAVAAWHRVAYARVHRLLDRRGLVRRGSTSGPGGIVPGGVFLALLAAIKPSAMAARLRCSVEAAYARRRRLGVRR